MKYLIIMFSLLFVLNGFAQIPLFGVQKTEGYQCPIQSLTNTADSIITSPVLYWREAKINTGAVSLIGFMKLTVGTDTLVTFYARQVMHRNPIISTDILYDSTGWRVIRAKDGDYIPAENDIDGTGTGFSINLAMQDWWMPSLGIQIRAYMASGATRTKQLEMYIVQTEENR